MDLSYLLWLKDSESMRDVQRDGGNAIRGLLKWAGRDSHSLFFTITYGDTMTKSFFSLQQSLLSRSIQTIRSLGGHPFFFLQLWDGSTSLSESISVDLIFKEKNCLKSSATKLQQDLQLQNWKPCPALCVSFSYRNLPSAHSPIQHSLVQSSRSSSWPSEPVSQSESMLGSWLPLWQRLFSHNCLV